MTSTGMPAALALGAMLVLPAHAQLGLAVGKRLRKRISGCDPV
jgi:hypothetical protein